MWGMIRRQTCEENAVPCSAISTGPSPIEPKRISCPSTCAVLGKVLHRLALLLRRMCPRSQPDHRPGQNQVKRQAIQPPPVRGGIARHIVDQQIDPGVQDEAETGEPIPDPV